MWEAIKCHDVSELFLIMKYILLNILAQRKLMETRTDLI